MLKITPTFIKFTEMKPRATSNRRDKYALYMCNYCHKEFEANYHEIKRGNKYKCNDCAIHNLSNHPIYRVWGNMKDRCFNDKHKAFKNYGRKNIIVCDEWRNNFKSFYDWSLLNGWDNGLSIDRIDNDGNYEPSNCRWATDEIQHQNTRLIMSTNKSGYRGVFFHKGNKKFLASIGVNGKKKYLGYFKTDIEAAIAYDNFVINNNMNNPLNFPIL